MVHSILVKFETYLLTEKCVSHNTFQAYRTDLKEFFQYLENNSFNIMTITTDIIRLFLKELNDKKNSARTRSRKISSLKAFFSFSHIVLGIKNISEEILFPLIEKRLPRYLKEEEVELLFQFATKKSVYSIRDKRNQIMLFLLYISGMRISELISLKIADINFDTHLISVAGKGGKNRMIPVPLVMISMLKEYLSTDFFKNRYIENFFLFPSSSKKPLKQISRQAFWIILQKICTEASLNISISPHQLRHSFATHMLKNGADLRSLQMILGHENLATVEIYTHVEKSYLRTIYDLKHPRA